MPAGWQRTGTCQEDRIRSRNAKSLRLLLGRIQPRSICPLFQIPFSRVEETLKEFSLLPFCHNKVQVLSKGLKQRVSIGRSLLADPSLLLFDEPTSGLDFEMTKEIYLLLKKIHALGKPILFTSHRPEEIKTLATRIMVLHQGALVFDGLPAEYFESNIHQNLYS